MAAADDGHIVTGSYDDTVKVWSGAGNLLDSTSPAHTSICL